MTHSAAANARAAREARRRRDRRRFWTVLLIGGAVALTAALIALRTAQRTRSFAWIVERGRRYIAAADSPAQMLNELQAWEDETGPRWSDRRAALTRFLIERPDVGEYDIALLLGRINSAAFPTREDWNRWLKTQSRVAGGHAPSSSRRDAVRLQPAWTAPIGLTSWFSTILPLDGRIYVASLGSAFDDPNDLADGVVCVDGATGNAALIFTPPRDRPGARDVIGIAAGDQVLFVACHHGMVYAVTPVGTVTWSVHVGSAVSGAPLATDLNGDHDMDVVLATRAGKVVALNGDNGRTVWASEVGPGHPAAGPAFCGATLALGDLVPGGDLEILATFPDGYAGVVQRRDGQVIWRAPFDAGTLAGGLCSGVAADVSPPAWVADNDARHFAIVPSGRTLRAVESEIACTFQKGLTCVGGLRTLADEAGAVPLLIAAPTGAYGGDAGGVAAMRPDRLQWLAPVGGAVWGTPAIADLNGDRQSELVVPVICSGSGDSMAGALVVLSSAGHMVERIALDYAPEASPVIADVDGDTTLEVLVADQSGRLRCFKSSGVGPVEWGVAHGDSHNTRNARLAYEYGQIPPGRQWNWPAR